MTSRTQPPALWRNLSSLWRRPDRRRRAGFRPSVEALECRRLLNGSGVPGVLFTPNPAPPSLGNGSGHAVLTNAHVQLLFWGSYWDNNPLAQQIYSAAQRIVSGPYLNALAQYSGIGQASLRPQWVVDHQHGLPGKVGDVETFVDDYQGTTVQNYYLPEPDDDPQIIYFVFTPPGVAVPTSPANGGAYHSDYKDYDFPLHWENVPYAWVSTPTSGSPQQVMDYITVRFSHELAEAATDTLPNADPAYQFPGGGEVGDVCQPNYYRLNGDWVNSYWSQADSACIVPTGGSDSALVNGKALTINGGQLQNVSDTIALDVSGGGVKATVNGDTFQFDPGQITSIQVNAASNTETIAVDGTLPKVPVTIDLGPGSDTVQLDPTQASDPIQSQVTVNATKGGKQHVRLAPTGSLSLIEAPVQIDGGGGTEQVILEGSYGGALTDTLTGSRTGSLPLGSFTLSYSDVSTLALGPAGTISKLTLQGGPFATELDTVSDAGAGSIQFDGALPDHGTLDYTSVTELDDLVSVPSAAYDFTGSGGVSLPYVAVADGPVLNGSQTTSLQQTFTYFSGGRLSLKFYTVMDPVDFASKGDVTVQGGSQDATIDVNNPNAAAGLATLEIDPGPGATTVDVESTSAAVATTVTNDGVWNNVETVDLNAPGQGVQAVNGTVDVENPDFYTGAKTNLLIDDSGDAVPQGSVYLQDGRLSGLAPATIIWGGISSLTVTGGGGGNTFNVASFGNLPDTTLHSGAGDDSITVSVSPMSGYHLTVDGGAGYDQLFIDLLVPSQVVGQTHGVVSVSDPAPNTRGSVIDYQDIEKLDVNQPPALGGDGNGLDGNGNLLPPSLGGPSFLPPNLGGPDEGPQLFMSRHKPGTKGGHPRRPRHAVRHVKQARRVKKTTDAGPGAAPVAVNPQPLPP